VTQSAGYFLPEYTAYEQTLSVFKNFVPLPFPLHSENGYTLSGEELRMRIEDHGLGVVALSNPCNPTGHLIEGKELSDWVAVARETKCSVVFDEFYSSYIWSHDEAEDGRTVSSAVYVEDVNDDPILIVDGLTKNWRVPGWRVCWSVGPEKIIEAMASAGSFLEGGANHPLQKAALPLLDPEFAHNDTKALQKHFRGKRTFLLKRLAELGFQVPVQPMGTFYVWVSLKHLPYPLDNGLSFFEEGLKEKVIVVPGIFFDVRGVGGGGGGGTFLFFFFFFCSFFPVPSLPTRVHFFAHCFF
jgi:aspartate/methionine/tyrosine aminotransferase